MNNTARILPNSIEMENKEIAVSFLSLSGRVRDKLDGRTSYLVRASYFIYKVKHMESTGLMYRKYLLPTSAIFNASKSLSCQL
jgi:hypothetical protein